ncbi:hypothetical protein [Peribacillus frigoritolerans]|uniref:hypothetical protein n=1 Tax=Peribacillus frigoritolerans TaxID=450367 RepID=UPI001070EE59|nr:hypothetical protein [Peribacillus frigoritolerans]TFH59176.1 hypothetical protein E4J71_21555 [Peribacillus frigoritolerans]
MNDSSNEEMTLERRKRIFQEELDVLWERRLIPKSDYIRIGRAYNRHFQLALHKQKRLEEERKKSTHGTETIIGESADKRVQDSLNEESSFQLRESSGLNESIMKDEKAGYAPIESGFEESLEPVKEINDRKPVIQKQAIKREKPVKPAKPKKTPEQIRERNISVILLTGVILLLFGGLILATTSWGNLNAVLKVFFVGMVSVIFAGMAFIASKLKIKQTAFAFLTLAGLFIPITILSASYYRIFGEYLSLNGDGRGLLGFLGGLLCLAIYCKIADYFKSKIFIFISIFTFGITCYFGLAFVTPTIEWMFLAIGILNLILVWNMEQLKNQKALTLFKPFIFQFIQFKLIVEAFVILTLFSSNLVYSLTLMVFSVLFLIFSVKFQKKYYEMAFSAVFTYGYIHLVYNSFISEYMIIAFALVPIIFTMLSKYLAKSKRTKLSKNFMITSLIESGIVFLYSNAMVYQDNYAQIFIALMLVSAQLAYVSLQSGNSSFTYPAVVVFDLAFLYLFFALPVSFSTILNLLFVVQVIQYLGVYLYNRHPRYSLFKKSILLISPMIMLVILSSKLSEMAWLAVSAELAMISGLFFITYIKDESKHMKENAIYGFPITFVLSLVAFYPYLTESLEWVQSNIPLSVYLMGVSLISIGAAYTFKKGYLTFFPVFAYSGQILSFLSLISIPFDSLNPLEASGVMAIATAMNGLSVHIHRKQIFWVPVVITSAGLYASLYDVFDFGSIVLKIAFVLLGPIVFFLLGEWLGKYSKNGKLYFQYTSHLANLLAIPVGYLLIIHTESSPFLYVAQLLIYILSALRAHVKWEKYVFTYLGFSTLFLQVHLFFANVGRTAFITSICMMITAGLITVLWSVSKNNWKGIMEFYLIPFIHLGISISILETAIRDFPLNREWVWVGVMTVQFVFAWYLLMKRNWRNYVAAPLSLAFIFYNMYVNTLPLVMAIIILLVCMAVMVMASRRHFKGLVIQEGTEKVIDHYRIFGLLYLCALNLEVFLSDTASAILGIFVSLLLPSYFILMGRFTLHQKEKSIYSGIAAIIGLFPFSNIIDYAHTLPIVTSLAVLFGCMAGMLLLSRLYSSGSLKKNGSGIISFDPFRIYGLFFLIDMNAEVFNDTKHQLLQVFVSLLLTAYFIFLRSLTAEKLERKIYSNISALVSLYPFLIIVGYADSLSVVMGLLFLFGCMSGMLLLSRRYFDGLIKKEEAGMTIDAYRIYGLLFLLAMNRGIPVTETSSQLLQVFVSLLITVYFILIGSFTKDVKEKGIYVWLTGILSLYPYWTITIYADTLQPFVGAAVLLGCTAIMVILSRKFFKGLLDKGGAGLQLDFYRVYGLLFLLAMNMDVLTRGPAHFILETFVALLIPAYFILMRSTTTGKIERKTQLAAAILFSLYPYWVIVDQLTIPPVLEEEVNILPLFIVSTTLLRKIFVKGKITQYIESGIVFLLFLALIIDAMAGNTIYDALIIGTVSLAAMLFGFMMKYKSYFIAGTGTILFNVYMNTNSMWGEMPWWLYLIIGGGLLIGIASFFEWKKQKDNRTSKEVLEKNKQRIKNWFNRWN